MMWKVLFFVLVRFSITLSSIVKPDDCIEFDLEQLEDYTSNLNFTEDYENLQDDAFDVDVTKLPFGNLKSDWNRIILLHEALLNDSVLQGKLKKLIKVLAVAHSEFMNATRSTFVDYNVDDFPDNGEYFYRSKDNNTEISAINETAQYEVKSSVKDPGNDFISKRLNLSSEMVISKFEDSSSDETTTEIIEKNEYSNYSDIYREETTSNVMIINENVGTTNTSTLDESISESYFNKIGPGYSNFDRSIPTVYQENTSFITDIDNQTFEKMESEEKSFESFPEIDNATEIDVLTNQWTEENTFIANLNTENKDVEITTEMGKLHEGLITNGNKMITFNATPLKQSSSTSTPQGTFHISRLSLTTNAGYEVENLTTQAIPEITTQSSIKENYLTRTSVPPTTRKNNFFELYYKHPNQKNPVPLESLYLKIKNLLRNFNVSSNSSDSAWNEEKGNNDETKTSRPHLNPESSFDEEIFKTQPNTPIVFPYAYFPRFLTDSAEQKSNEMRPWGSMGLKDSSVNAFKWPYRQEQGETPDRQRFNNQQKPIMLCRTCVICTEE